MIEKYIRALQDWLPVAHACDTPWSLSGRCRDLVTEAFAHLGPEFTRDGDVAIHQSAIIESGVILKGPLIVGERCFIAAHAYLRGGVFLASGVSIGPGCEVKSSLIGPDTALAH